MSLPRRLAALLAIVALSIGCDQTTKRIASDELRGQMPISFLGDAFRLQYSENPGSFLGLGATMSADLRFVVFILGVGVLLTWLAIYIIRAEKPRPWSVVGVALILGGGLSNWIDRVLNGNVVIDFMNVGIGSIRSGIFNVADLLIEAGIVIFLIAHWRASRRPRVEPAETPHG